MRPYTIALAVPCLTAALAAAIIETVAVPPPLVNYQGILRDGSGEPLDGTFDMVFIFYDGEGAVANQILIDSHAGPGTSAVTVTGGLFNVTLGSGAVSDGAGPGVYTSLDAVLQDHTEVWMEIHVAAPNEPLHALWPRIRVGSAAYALDAAKVGGLNPANLINTSSTPQSKAGPLSLGNGLTAYSSTFAVYGVGAQSGGAFANQDLTSIALIGHSASGYYGLKADGIDAGGFFRDADNLGQAYLGYGDVGVQATGAIGATLYAQGATGIADLGDGATGIDARGDGAGGFMINTATGGAFSTLAGSWGIDASGVYCSSLCGAGGHFSNAPYSGQMWAGVGDSGIYSIGTAAGGEFDNTLKTGHSWLGAGEFGAVGYGAYNDISSEGAGGYFADVQYGGRAALGSGGLGVWGSGYTAGGQFININGYINDGGWAASGGDGVRGWTDAPHVSGKFYWRNPNDGSVPMEVGVAFTAINDKYTISGSGIKAFAQNDPDDENGQVVFVTLEGDESGTYTRGTGRIEGGEARVSLSPGFAAATNPDIGLTAMVTPRGAAVPLAIAELTADALVVRGGGPEADGTVFDFAVYGLRLGFEHRPAVQEKREDAPIPPDADGPAGPSSPLARFTSMRRAIGEAAPDFTRTETLKAAARRASSGLSGPRPGQSQPNAAQATKAGPQEPPAAHAALRPAGSVVAFDAALGTFVPATGSPGEIVAGIVGLELVAGGNPGDDMRTLAFAPGGSITLCQAEAEGGGIRVGDLLAPSAIPGRARRASDDEAGAVIAKALEPLAEGSGTIRVLVLSR